MSSFLLSTDRELLSPGRYNHIFPDGTNEWRAAPDRINHSLLEWVPGARDECRAEIDGLMAHQPMPAR